MASAAFPQLAKKATLSDGTTYGYVYAPASPSKPTFLLCHGAPSSSYIWHHQIEYLSKAGFGVLAPDLIGYGDTDQPKGLKPYQLKKSNPQVIELATKVVGLNKVIGVGHDWGSTVLSHLYIHNKDLFSSLIFIAVGYYVFEQTFSIDARNEYAMKTVGYPISGYQHVFVSPEGASLIEANDKVFDSLMYAKDPEAWKKYLGPDGALKKFLEAGKELPLADWITPEELATHNRILKGRYDGVLNWYKAADELGPAEQDQALTAEQKKIEVPTLLMVTEKDYAIMPELQAHMTQAAAQDLQVERLPTGHWAMLEDKSTVNKLMEKFATDKS